LSAQYSWNSQPVTKIHLTTAVPAVLEAAQLLKETEGRPTASQAVEERFDGNDGSRSPASPSPSAPRRSTSPAASVVPSRTAAQPIGAVVGAAAQALYQAKAAGRSQVKPVISAT
jgi:hypothetical protein